MSWLWKSLAPMAILLLLEEEKSLAVVSREALDVGEEQEENVVCLLPAVQWKASAGLENEQA